MNRKDYETELSEYAVAEKVLTDLLVFDRSKLANSIGPESSAELADRTDVEADAACIAETQRVRDRLTQLRQHCEKALGRR